MRTPNLFIVGAPRSGTTSMYAYLGEHPDVFVSPLKEPKFFASDLFGDARTVSTRDAYLRCFEAAAGEKRVGEASTCYLGSRTAAAQIKAFSPDARIIIMLRNPVDVMYATHSGRVFDCLEPFLRFEDALAADENPRLGLSRWSERRLPQLSYKDLVRYASQVRRHLDVFGAENVHIIIYDDFKSDTARSYRETLRFLGVDVNFTPAFPILNANQRVRSIALQRMVAHPPAALRNILQRITTLEARRSAGRCLLALNVSQRHRPPMDPGLRNRLVREFEPEISDLGRLINRDLSGWLR